MTVGCVNESRMRLAPDLKQGAGDMHNIFYIIGLVVVALAILRLAA